MLQLKARKLDIELHDDHRHVASVKSACFSATRESILRPGCRTRRDGWLKRLFSCRHLHGFKCRDTITLFDSGSYNAVGMLCTWAAHRLRTLRRRPWSSQDVSHA